MILGQLLQDIIHKLEVGPGMRYLKIALATMVLLILVFGYNVRSYRNFNTLEAMDTAQVARKVSEGKGFSTGFVRPFSIYLVKKRSEATFGLVAPDPEADYARVKGEHPDIANAPLYSCVLAGLMKVLPFKWEVETKGFWGNGRMFWRHQPDFLIAVFNEFLFLIVIVFTYFLARRLFDRNVAWLASVLLLCAEMLWRFSVSGLSTMLLLLIFMGLVWCLVVLEREAREPRRGLRALLMLAATAGLLAGLGALTRYSFGWLIIPVVVFIILFGGPRNAALCLLTVAMFAAVLTPWLYRNYKISGVPFGTATFAVIENTTAFPLHKLSRSLEPNLKHPDLRLASVGRKLMVNGRQILQNDLPQLGGSWLTALFLTGLLLGFNNPALRRLRYFIMMCLATLAIVQALGRTQLSDDSPELNSENLLILLVPVVFIYGVSLFYLLLDQMNLLFRGLRYLIIVVFAVVVCLPMIVTFLAPKTVPVAHPPYYPPTIQQVSALLRENELMMSDLPWAVAWYGDRQCVWLTLNATVDPKTKDSRETVFQLNDFVKPVRGLYLGPRVMDGRFLTDWVQGGEFSWGSFVIDTIATKQVPPQFPLRYAQGDARHGHIFLTDWERWKASASLRTPPAAPAKK